MRPSDGDVVGALLYLDAQAALRVGVGRAGDSTVQAGHGHGLGPARQADPVRHLGDGADGSERVVVARHEQHAVFVAGVDRQGDVHRREDDGVVERDEKERCRHSCCL